MDDHWRWPNGLDALVPVGAALGPRALDDAGVRDGEREGEVLDLTKTPAQLRLAGRQKLLAEEVAAVGLQIRFRHLKSVVTLTAKPTAAFDGLFEQWCKQHGGGRAPAAFKFEFDGDLLKPTQTPQHLDMESGELVDVIARK